MAPKTTAPRTLADFPTVVEAQQRLGDLYAKFNQAREELIVIQAGAPKPMAVREEDHVDALLAGADPNSINLDAVKEYHARVQAQEQTVTLLRRAIQKQEQKVADAAGEASAAILRERKPELTAKTRATVAAMLRLIKAHEAEKAFRSELDQQGVSGAHAVWQPPSFWICEQLGGVREPDSSIARVLREAQGMGIVTADEVAKIRAGGDLPAA